MKINELEFQDANGNEINPIKKQNLQRETFWIYESELFATKSEAEEALKKLEENNVKD